MSGLTFIAMLARLVVAGEKTVTRRVPSDLVVLGDLDDAEARREGCQDADEFRAIWTRLHGRYYRHQQVWRVEMEPVQATGREGVGQ